MEPTPEHLPLDTDIFSSFIACDPVNSSTAGTIYRAFRGGVYYVLIDTRRASSNHLAWITGGGMRLIGVRFGSRDERETWLSEVLQAAQTSARTGNFVRNGGRSGGGAPLQPALRLPMSRKHLDA